MKFNEKLKIFRKEAKITQVELAKKLNVTQGTVANWERGVREPDIETIQRIADALNININTLFSDLSHSNNRDSIEVLPADGIRKIPLFESVAAGFGAYPDSTVIGYIPVYISSDWEAEHTIAIKVKGDSMYPKIEDGDIVVVCKDADYSDGQIVVVRIDETEAVVKRIHLSQTRLVLESINPEYKDRVFDREEMNRITVEGVVRKIVKDV